MKAMITKNNSNDKVSKRKINLKYYDATYLYRLHQEVLTEVVIMRDLERTVISFD